MNPTDANPDYLPRDPDPSVLCHRDLVERVEKLKERLHNQTSYSQRVHQEIHDKVLATLERMNAVPEWLDKQGHPIEQIVGTCVAKLQVRLDAVTKLARKHNNPSVNIGAHALAGKILKILEGEQ
jgi:hypothetical protein